MYSCRRRLGGRLPRVLAASPQLRRLQHHDVLPVTPCTKQQCRRLTPWPQGLVETSVVVGNEGATNASVAARSVHFWRRGSSLPSLQMTGDKKGARPSCFERCMSTTMVAGGEGVGSAPPPPTPPPPPPPSLQERLGISDAEAEIVRKNNQTSEKGFDNLMATSHGRGDEIRGGSTGTQGAGPASSDSRQSLPPPKAAAAAATAYSCFPVFLLDDLHAEPERVKSLVLRRPAVLGWSTGATERMSRWLQESLGMRRAEVARLLLRHPETGTKGVETNAEIKVEWLRKNLNLGIANDHRGVAKLLLRAPQILNLSVERSLDPMLVWLKDRLGVSKEEAAKIGRDNPAIFWLSTEGNLEPTLAWLQERLETDKHGVAQMVTAAPKILSLNVHTGLEPKLAWLRDRVGLTQAEVCDVVGREPTILSKSVRGNLQPTQAWLKTHLRLHDEAAREMFVAFPRLVGSSLGDNLKLKIPWLQRSLGLGAREAVALARRAPALLQYSIEHNLDPTVSFFREEMNASEEELREAVVRNPKLLGYSLDRRLRPRVAAMREASIEPVFSEHRNHVGRWDDAKFRGFIERHGR